MKEIIRVNVFRETGINCVLKNKYNILVAGTKGTSIKEKQNKKAINRGVYKGKKIVKTFTIDTNEENVPYSEIGMAVRGLLIEISKEIKSSKKEKK